MMQHAINTRGGYDRTTEKGTFGVSKRSTAVEKPGRGLTGHGQQTPISSPPHGYEGNRQN